MTRFVADVYQNEYLPADGSEVNAIVTVTVSRDDGAAIGNGPVSPPEAAEIVIVDTSGSMGVPRAKIKAAREATSVAIDCIRDGVAFAVIAGTESARMVYPEQAQLMSASGAARQKAKRAASRLEAGGGTAIGSWLTLARELFATEGDRVCHAILLTDGQNQN
jgi:Mg-chelatase subunit ChlD